MLSTFGKRCKRCYRLHVNTRSNAKRLPKALSIGTRPMLGVSHHHVVIVSVTRLVTPVLRATCLCVSMRVRLCAFCVTKR